MVKLVLFVCLCLVLVLCGFMQTNGKLDWFDFIGLLSGVSLMLLCVWDC